MLPTMVHVPVIQISLEKGLFPDRKTPEKNFLHGIFKTIQLIYTENRLFTTYFQLKNKNFCKLAALLTAGIVFLMSV